MHPAARTALPVLRRLCHTALSVRPLEQPRAKFALPAGQNYVARSRPCNGAVLKVLADALSESPDDFAIR